MEHTINPQNPDTSIAIGDRVRSYDFPDGRLNSYVEGTVTNILTEGGCPRYEIKVEHQVFGGEEVPKEEMTDVVYPPVNGTPVWIGGGVTFGVVKI